MRLGTPFEALHEALAAAAHRDIPEITYEDRDWDAWRKLSKEEQGVAMKTDTVPRVSRIRRPMSDELEVVMFLQTWGSTATGYGGMGGAAMTSAYTIIVSDQRCHCVYFGCGRLAYKLTRADMSNKGKDNFLKDMTSHNIADVRGSSKYR